MTNKIPLWVEVGRQASARWRMKITQAALFENMVRMVEGTLPLHSPAQPSLQVLFYLDHNLFSTSGETSVNRKDLQALNLVGPTSQHPVLFKFKIVVT